MRCPHCNTNDNSKVVETRKHDGAVYRRRKCFSCDANFVSLEGASADTRMPPEALVRKNAGQRSRRGNNAPKPIASEHLQSIWK